MSPQPAPSDGVVAFFAGDHQACDQRWAEVEAAVGRRDLAGASAAWDAFAGATRRHLAMEEEILFPAFERVSGMTTGPTTVMRMEHDQMRGLLERMAGAAAAGDWEAVLDHGDTLLMLTQQHNAKEEGMLYPMAEQFLAGEWAELAPHCDRRMKA